jgi:hypothetical protein
MPTYLNVSYEDKDDAKRQGARWDATARRWYVPDGVPLGPFARWQPAAVEGEEALIAPIFLRKSSEPCYKCSAVSEVFCLGATAVRDVDVEDDGGVYKHEHDNLPGLVNVANLEQLDARLVAALARLAPRYKLDYSHTQRAQVWINHCQHCGAKLGDFYMHNEPDGAFFPTSPDDKRISDTLLFEQGEFAYVGSWSMI